MSTESPKTPNIIPLQQTVYNVLNDLGIYSKENYLRFMQFAIRGLKDLNLHSAPGPEVVYLTSTVSGIVDLPQDFISDYKIGIKRNGRIWTLTKINDLLLPRTDECGEPQAEGTFSDHAVTFNDSEVANQVVYYTPHFNEGGYVGALYGAIGGINSGYYRIDYERNQLVLSNVAAGTTIVVEYKSTGVSMTASTLIPAESEEFIIAYIHWRRTQFDTSIPAGMRAEAKQNFIEAEESYRTKRYCSFTVDDYLDSLYSGLHGTIRR